MTPDVVLVLMWAVVLVFAVAAATIAVRKRYAPVWTALQLANVVFSFTELLDALDALPPT